MPEDRLDATDTLEPPMIYGRLEGGTTPALQLQPKVTAATLGGSLATIAVVVLENYGVTVTAELGAALATVAAAVLGWAVKS